jgi:hypothetical protein
VKQVRRLGGYDRGAREASIVERVRLTFSGPARPVALRLRGVSMVRRTLLAIFLLALPAFGVACSSDDEPSAKPTSTTVATTTSTSSAPRDGDEAAVRDAYDAANKAFIDAAAIPDPERPDLIATHTGPMLKQRQDVLRALKADGRIIRYPSPSKYQVTVDDVVIEGDVARLRFCAIDDGERVAVATGEVVSAGVITARGRAALQLVNGSWRLAEQEFDSREDGEVACG